MMPPPIASIPEVSPKLARKVTAAGCVGVFVELYDNGIFAFMASTLALVFFDASPDKALVLVFASYAVSFFVRPLGAMVCGILGDRLGRQKPLVFVIMMISVATAAIGLLPSYKTIGIGAPILLILLRLAQGFSVGGEAAGAMTFLAEYAPANKRGLYTSYAQVASFAALFVGTLVAYLIYEVFGGNNSTTMLSWGWRIPFLLAVPMGMIGWYIRTQIMDTPNFLKLKEEGGLSKNPLKEAFS